MFATHIADGAGQGLLQTKKRYVDILNTLPSDSVRKELYDRWEASGGSSAAAMTGADRWAEMVAATTLGGDRKRKPSASVNYVDLESWRVQLVLTHCYPR